jgi:hypothetical protein
VDESGQRCLRVIFRTSFDPMEHAVEMLGGADPTAFIKRLSVLFESSLNFDRFLEEDFAASQALRYRVNVDVEVDQALADLLSTTIGDNDAAVFLKLAKLFQEFETVLKVRDPVAALSDDGSLAEFAPMFTGVIVAAQNQLRAVKGMPAEAFRENVPPPMLNYVRLGPRVVKGFRRVQAQSRNMGLQVVAKGIDIMQYMPLL